MAATVSTYPYRHMPPASCPGARFRSVALQEALGSFQLTSLHVPDFALGRFLNVFQFPTIHSYTLTRVSTNGQPGPLPALEFAFNFPLRTASALFGNRFRTDGENGENGESRAGSIQRCGPLAL